MNYVLLSLIQMTTTKERKCCWCPEPIEVGSKYQRECGTYDGFFHRVWHMECWEASQKMFTEDEDDNQFELNSFKRGTCEEI